MVNLPVKSSADLIYITRNLFIRIFMCIYFYCQGKLEKMFARALIIPVVNW